MARSQAELPAYDFGSMVKGSGEAVAGGSYAFANQRHDANFGRIGSGRNAYNMVALEQKLSSPDHMGGFQKNEPFLRSFNNTN